MHMVLFVMHLDIDTKRHPVGVVHSCYSCGAAFSVTEAHLQYMPE